MPHPDFYSPSPGSIKGRLSSITAAFVQAVIPSIEPTENEVDEVLQILGMQRGNCRCAYCGDASTEWDHFRAIVSDRRPTGYITEISNLVPACGKCNQSKGNKPWKTWITSAAPRSPASRGVNDLENKISKLETFENWRQPQKINFETLLGVNDWEGYWSDWQRFFDLMTECQAKAALLRERIEEKMSEQGGAANPLQPSASGDC